MHAWIPALCCLLACLPLRASAGDLPAWPRHGVAERRFLAGDAMFIERRADAWRAWVLPDASRWTTSPDTTAHRRGWRGEVLDFFSGALVDAELHEDEMGRARPVFFTVGGVHAPAWLDGGAAVSLGLLHERRFGGLRFVDDERLDASRIEGCDTRFMAVEGMGPGTGSPPWSRLVLRRSPPTAECPHGRWSSQVLAVLDLFDGTFLAALDDRVVRLDMSGLAPVGVGAEVAIVDTDLVVALVEAGGDLHERLNAALSARGMRSGKRRGTGGPRAGAGNGRE